MSPFKVMKFVRQLPSLILSITASFILFGQLSFENSAGLHGSKGLLVWIKAVTAGEINWSSKSTPTFGHAFLKHGQGSKNTTALKGTAGGTGTPQGQWLDDEKAALFLKNLYPTISGSVTTPISPGLGQVIKPDGSIVPATHATVWLRQGGVYETAYPVIK
jgi:hypothetical protein